MVSDIFLELVRLNPFQKGIACRNRSKITDFMENFQSLVKKWQKLAKNRFFSAAQAFFHPRTDFFIPYASNTCPESGIWPGTLNSKIEPTLLYILYIYDLFDFLGLIESEWNQDWNVFWKFVPNRPAWCAFSKFGNWKIV